MAAAKGKKVLPKAPDALDVLAAEASGPAEYLSVSLGEEQVRVKEPMDWPSSAMAAMRQGNFEVWAEKCLVRDDDADDYATWQSVDPTYRQIAQFMAAYRDAGGREPGE